MVRNYTTTIFHSIRQSWYLAIGQLRQRYAVTRLGFLWLFIHPISVFAIFYYMSVYGLKMGLGAQGVPFFAFLFSGLLVWNTVGECTGASTACFSSNRLLLFDRAASTTVLVISTVLSSALIHIFLAVVVVTIFVIDGITISPQIVLLPYYYLCLLSLLFTVALIVAPLSARSPDAIQIVNSLLFLWFWLSPIIWSPKLLSPNALQYLSLNPTFYIISGYRNALIYSDQFHSIHDHIQFWIVIFLGISIGLLLLHRSESRLREWLLR